MWGDKMKTRLKALALIGMGLFLCSRFINGALFYYINERFLWLILFASLGFILVGMSYRYRPQHAHHHEHDGHEHYQFSWFGLFLVLLPVALGLLMPPKPLGAAAMVNRDISIDSLTSASNTIIAKPKGNRNVLDWLIDFRTAKDPAAFAGEEAKVIGFVYRDDRFAPEEFMVARFVLSCCAADASPLGLVVRWPEGASLADDSWVEVEGHFEPGRFAGEEMPILIAESVTPTEIPERPYLYPF
jgi:uncharacterized repeat protein (TIGR03943 family)